DLRGPSAPGADHRRRPSHPPRHDLQARRMSLVAVARPDSWNAALFVHVLGAMILVGGLVGSAGLLALARGDVRLLRFGYWALLAVSLPGWILMRIGAEWVSSREGWNDLPSGVDQPTWLDLGRIIADGGGAILLLALILGGIGVRRLGQGRAAGLLQTTLYLTTILLAADLVAVWAMAGKPS